MTDQLTDEKPAPAPDTHPESRQGLLLPIVHARSASSSASGSCSSVSRASCSRCRPAAATAVALVVAVSIMGVATIVASRERLSNGTLFSMIGVVAGVAMLAGGIAIVTIGTGEEAGGGGGPQVVALAAPKGAAATGFQPTTLSVAADKPIELDFTNQDPGIQHNVVIFGEDPAKNPNATPRLHRRSGHGARTRPSTPCRHCRPARSTSTARCTRRRCSGRSSPPSVGAAGQPRARPSPPRAVVRHQGDRPSGRAADDDHVRQRGRRHPAQHRHLHRQLAVDDPVPGRAVPGRGNAGVSDPGARSGDVLLPLRRPHHHERHRGRRPARRGSGPAAPPQPAPRVRRRPAEHSSRPLLAWTDMARRHALAPAVVALVLVTDRLQRNGRCVRRGRSAGGEGDERAGPRARRRHGGRRNRRARRPPRQGRGRELLGDVVRSVPHRATGARATLGRLPRHEGVEFLGVPERDDTAKARPG